MRRGQVEIRCLDRVIGESPSMNRLNRVKKPFGGLNSHWIEPRWGLLVLFAIPKVDRSSRPWAYASFPFWGTCRRFVFCTLRSFAALSSAPCVSASLGETRNIEPEIPLLSTVRSTKARRFGWL